MFKLKSEPALLRAVTCLLFCSMVFSACKKTVTREETGTGSINAPAKPFEKPAPKKNPFSLSNVRTALKALYARGERNGISSFGNNDDQINQELSPADQFLYMAFDPQTITETQISQLEANPDVQIMNFPFANGEIYDENAQLTPEDLREIGNLTPDSLYISGPRLDSVFQHDGSNRWTNNPGTTVIDTLYKIDDSDIQLQIEALVQAGWLTREQANQLLQQGANSVKAGQAGQPRDLFGICLLKRPHGHVRYNDQELIAGNPNHMEPVRRIQVWALVFGIPVHTYTDNNGYYEIPWRFNAGTIIGTHARNDRVNVKPFNTRGSLLVGQQIIADFIAGSIQVLGYKSSCDMKNDIDINFTGHTQARYWSQILNAVSLHDDFTQADNILKAPDQLTIYAQWADQYNGDKTRDGIAQASTPMLRHIAVQPGGLVVQTIQSFFGDESPSNYPNLMGLVTGLLPDITVRISGDQQPLNYSSRLAQTLFHELSHASYFRKVGSFHWLTVELAESFTQGPCGGYGCGGHAGDGNVQVAESWAEFLGTVYAARRYPGGVKFSHSITTPGYINLTASLERETFFLNDWIPVGIYNDLMDVENLALENWDHVEGLTINQLYDAFQSNVNSICDYRARLLQLNAGLNPGNVNLVFNRNLPIGRTCP